MASRCLHKGYPWGGTHFAGLDGCVDGDISRGVGRYVKEDRAKVCLPGKTIADG